MTTYNLDPQHSHVGFSVRHAMVSKVRGSFSDATATLTLNEDHGQVTGTVNTASIDTKNADRDEHVRGADFFDVANYPTMEFTAEFPYTPGTTTLQVPGELTIKGTTLPVTFDVEVFGESEDPFGNTRLGFEARTVIDRTKFGIDFNAPLNTGGVLLSEKITIEIEGSAIAETV